MRLWLAGFAAPVAILAALSGAPALAQVQAPPAAVLAPAPDAALSARIDAVVDRAIADQRLVGAVVLVARDGKLVYHRAAGLADREAKAPMRENTVFRLASVTKPFVSVAIMRLAEEGRLSLADPVTRWLPDFKPTLADGSTPTITLGQLLSHTAGLTYGLAEKADHPYHQLGVSDGLDISGLTLDEDVARIGKGPSAFSATSPSTSMASE